MIDPAARLVNALKTVPGMMQDAIYRVPGKPDVPCRVNMKVSVETRQISDSIAIKAGVRLCEIHDSDIGTAAPEGYLYVVADDKTYRVQTAADRDKSGWWLIGLTNLRERP